jgi:hypothetical protein
LFFTLNTLAIKSHESIAEMNIDPAIMRDNRNRNGSVGLQTRVLAGHRGWMRSGPGWHLLRQPVETSTGDAGPAGDCWLVESGEAAAIAVDDLARSGLPLVVALTGGADTIDAPLLDSADGFIFADDDEAVVAAVFRAAIAPDPGLVVRDLSDGTARMINALSAEAGRIADQLARLAEAQREAPVGTRPVDAALIRRMLRLRRDRERYFPAEIFADPAWDMLLDLTAAQLEGRLVPVSSLCIAAAVPTTTALRWVRSLTEAGLLERRMDPADARRSHIRLSDDASSAMLSYLRLFSEAFALR